MITLEQAEKVKEIVSGFDEEQKKQFLEKYSSLNNKGKETVIGRLINITETKVQEPIKQGYLSGVKQRGSEAQQEISGRGTILGNVEKSALSNNRIAVGVQTIGAPFTALQAAISNPAIAMQQGEFSPTRLLSES